MSETRFFEDIQLGEKFKTGTFELTAEKVHEFASEYDPQFIHVDEDASKNGPFGTIIASGWQTLSATMRLMALEKPFGNNPLIGMRIDELKFAKPVYPGEAVYVDAEVVSLKASTKGERGYVGIRLNTKTTHNDEIVATQIWTCLVPSKTA
ncbi:MaoC/PaaZ C-terminal domain-containing protein [uncultured Maritalea sp.]|uniref:MaoC/PaaZ C-terminal domain-containing protein n=1 Tax=uncultured Maritalea sp. TaxID=757249 RepID=UPI002617376F|nr:MaoC/PaaZ C-terminal domain-containing protein [uncultured Maritalea sp.]